jgi:hypothetical protein
MIDEYLVQTNRWLHESGSKKIFGLEEAIEMLNEKERETKVFEEKLLNAQRPL